MFNQKFQGWTATLSNGDIAWETEPEPGERTPWQKLLDRLEKENLKITSLRVQRGKTTLHALPHKECDGYFQAYEVFMSSQTKLEYKRQGCGSIVGDKIFITWIDENGNVWGDVRNFTENKIHTTLKHM